MDPPPWGRRAWPSCNIPAAPPASPRPRCSASRNLLANVAQINAWLPRLQYARERVVGLMPFFHAFGLTVCLNWPLSQAAQILILPKFDIKTLSPC